MTENHDIKVIYPRWYSPSANTIFTYIMNISVLVSSFILAFDDPFADPKSNRKKILLGFDILFSLIFITEMIIKIIALGFLKTALSGKSKKAYLQDPWNRLDFFLVWV